MGRRFEGGRGRRHRSGRGLRPWLLRLRSLKRRVGPLAPGHVAREVAPCETDARRARHQQRDHATEEFALLAVAKMSDEESEEGFEAFDDAKGGMLPLHLVREARKVEMQFVKDRDIYEYKPISECLAKTGRPSTRQHQMGGYKQR